MAPLPRSVRLLEVLATVAVAGCVSGGQALEVPPNPPGCEAVVERHREDPGLSVDSMPRPAAIAMFPTDALVGAPNPIHVTFLVSEEGIPVAETVVVTGVRSRTIKRRIAAELQKWRFVPARVGECWVRAPFRYTLQYVRRRSFP